MEGGYIVYIIDASFVSLVVTRLPRGQRQLRTLPSTPTPGQHVPRSIG